MDKERFERIMQMIDTRLKTLEIDLKQFPANPARESSREKKAELLAMINQLRWIKQLLEQG